MKWLFLLNDVPFLAEFFGKFQEELLARGDECITVFNSKISEFRRKKFLPKGGKIVSRVDWCVENYKDSPNNFSGLSWKEVFPLFDRFKSRRLSFQDAKTIVGSTFQVFEEIFEKEKPDVVISEIPPDIFHEVAYLFSKKYGVPYLGIEDSKFENRIDAYDVRFYCKRCEYEFNSLQSNEINQQEKAFIDTFVKNLTEHKISLGSDSFSKIKISQWEIVKHYLSNAGEFIKVFFSYAKKRSQYRVFDYESETIIKKSLQAPFHREKRQFNMSWHKKIFDLPKLNDLFFFYPLPFQPESSTMVYATYYVDQLETLRNICFSLPFPYKLYIKEHPGSIGLRSLDFYQTIKNIPNAVLLSPDENVDALIQHAAGVVTLTGTVGLEAALIGKKSYILGEPYYSYHPFCIKVNGFYDLKEKIERQLKEKEADNSNLKNINYRFIYSYFKNTIQGRIAWVSIGQDTNDYPAMVEDFKKIILKVKEKKIC